MRLLIVAMAESIHTANWIGRIADQGWDLHLFSVIDEVPHPKLKNVTVHTYSARKHPQTDAGAHVRSFWGISWGSTWLTRLCSKLCPRLLDKGKWLARIIEKVQPDYIHSLEIQHAGYLVLEARKRLGGKMPPWVVTNWGSDIYLFGRLKEHRAKIREILSVCDFYSCECHRDVALARDFGFRGTILPVYPVSGGFDLDDVGKLRSPGPTSQRRLIVLKGYQHFAGRALTGLTALRMCAQELRGYRVAIYKAVPEVVMAAELFAHETGIPVDIVPPCSHDDMLRLFGRARAYVGLSISDGISTSLLEALVMGAFPIQSCTACADEWLVDGETGFIVPPEAPRAVAAALRRALTDDALVDRAAERNAALGAERLDHRLIREKTIDYYQKIFAANSKKTEESLLALSPSERCGGCPSLALWASKRAS